MSVHAIDEISRLTINDQIIEVRTTVDREMKNIVYAMTSSGGIAPETVAVALYLMCKDICGKMDITVDDLVSEIVESGGSWH